MLTTVNRPSGLLRCSSTVAPAMRSAWLSGPAGDLPLPATGVLGIPQSVLSRDVRRVIGLRGVLRALGDAVVPLGEVSGDETVDSLVRRRVGARVAEAGKRGGVLEPARQTAPQVLPPDVWLLFAPVKKARTDFIVEKAVEMGVRRLLPVATEFTNSERIRQDRLQAHAREAAEQCGGNYVPEVSDATKLSDLLDGWDDARRILFCDEGLVGTARVLAVVGAPEVFEVAESQALQVLRPYRPHGPGRWYVGGGSGQPALVKPVSAAAHQALDAIAIEFEVLAHISGKCRAVEPVAQ